MLIKINYYQFLFSIKSKTFSFFLNILLTLKINVLWNEFLGSFARHYNYHNSSSNCQFPQRHSGTGFSSATVSIRNSNRRYNLKKQHSSTTRGSLSQNDSFESNGSGTNFLTPTRGATSLGLFSSSFEGGSIHLHRSHSDAQELRRRPSSRLGGGSSTRPFIGTERKLRKMYRRPSHSLRVGELNTGKYLKFGILWANIIHTYQLVFLVN